MNPTSRGPGGSKLLVVVIFLALAASIFVYQSQSESTKDSLKSTLIKGFSKSGISDITNQNGDLDQQKRQFERDKKDRVAQVRSASKANQILDFETFVVPQVSCPTMVRVGAIGDGGKWVCNPWRVPNDCVVYSLGVMNDTSFEMSMHEASGRRCKFYCVDHGDQDENLFKAFNGTFLKAAIGGQTDKRQNQISLADMMAKFNHSKIDILKMDIEGSEFESLTSFLNTTDFSDKETTMCQLMVEIHKFNGRVESWLKLFELLEAKGFRVYSKEANMICTSCHEFSFLHLSCYKQYGLANDSTFFKYFV